MDIPGPMKEFCKGLEDVGGLSEALTLRCLAHDVDMTIRWPAQLLAVSPEGGCDELCLRKLPNCDHLCPFVCHQTDVNHELPKYKCRLSCDKDCGYGKYRIPMTDIL